MIVCPDQKIRTLASIGPRSFNRGNLVISACGIVNVMSLQLGRGLSTAETHFLAPLFYAPLSLQLGRGLSTAETS
jgi:hypothetical protein